MLLQNFARELKLHRKLSTDFKENCELVLGNSVMVAQLTLDQLVQVRILVPQLFHWAGYQNQCAV